jgi:hypothetical protein
MVVTKADNLGEGLMLEGWHEVYTVQMQPPRCYLLILEQRIHRSNCIIKGWYQWLMPVILATWETEIGRIAIQDQPR